MFSEATKTILAEKLPEAAVKQRTQGTMKLSYVEAHHAIREANRAFGFDGWARETVESHLVQQEERDGKCYVGYIAKARVTAGGVVREGTGFGQGIDRDAGRAHESAIKEAESDAMKRALMTFGDIFGLALYDKTQANVEKEPPAQESKADVAPPRTGFGTADARIYLEGVFGNKDDAKEFWRIASDGLSQLTPAVAVTEFCRVLSEGKVKEKDEVKAALRIRLEEAFGVAS